MLTTYTYANIVRVLSVNENDFTKSRMIDINTNDWSILNEFDAARTFDADFIRSYLNIINESKVDFRPLTNDSPEDIALREKALKVVLLN